MHKKVTTGIKLPKGFLILAFFLSIFSFTGFAGNIAAKENKITQTEIVFSAISKTKKSTAHYKNFSTQVGEVFSYTISKKFILEFNRLVQIKFNVLSKRKQLSTILFFQNKLLPQYNNEAPANASIKG